MQRTVVTAVLLQIGCGRLQFGPAATDAGGPDAGDAADADAADACIPVGHDEDGDTIDDACDVCPQRDDTQQDTDGDGVGDSCDRATTAQTLTLFDPFTIARAEWNYVNASFPDNDTARFNVPIGGAGADLVAPPGRDSFELVGAVLAVNAGQPRQISLGIRDAVAGTSRYYCELYDDGGQLKLQLTYTLDGTSYFNIDQQMLPTRLDAGMYRLLMDHDPPTSTCIAEWMGGVFTVGGTNPAIAANIFDVSFFQIDAEVHSFARVTTP